MIRRSDDQMIRCVEDREPAWFPPPEPKWRPALQRQSHCLCSLMLHQKVWCQRWFPCCSDVAWLFPDWGVTHSCILCLHHLFTFGWGTLWSISERLPMCFMVLSDWSLLKDPGRRMLFEEVGKATKLFYFIDFLRNLTVLGGNIYM